MVWLHDRAVRIYAHGGRRYAVGVFSDVTERKRIEEALRRSEERYRLLVDDSPAGQIIVQAAPLRIVAANKAVEKITGYRIPELLSLCPRKMMAAVHAEDRFMLARRFSRRLRRIPVPEHCMIRVRNRDGEMRWVEVYGARAEHDGRPAIHATLLDRTRRVRTENRLKLLSSAVEQVNEGIAVCNPKGALLYCNRAFAETHGLKGGGADAGNLCEFRGRKGMPGPILARLRKTGEYAARGEHARRNGTRFPTLEHFSILRSDKGVPVGMIVVCRDITEMQKAEDAAQIKRYSAMLIRMIEDERRRIALELHDQVGQNLAAARLALERVMRRKAKTGVVPLEGVRDAARLLEFAIQDARDISYRMHPPALDNLGLVPCIRSEIDFVARFSGIRIGFKSERFHGKVDPQKAIAIYRVVQEALTNVMKHSRCNRAEVALAMKDRKIALRISDNGRGFDPLRVRHTGGMGIVGIRERVEAIGGTTQVRSSAGRGTRLDIEVPLCG